MQHLRSDKEVTLLTQQLNHWDHWRANSLKTTWNKANLCKKAILRLIKVGGVQCGLSVGFFQMDQGRGALATGEVVQCLVPSPY